MIIPELTGPISSGGEKLVINRFRNDKDCTEMYILHSLFISKHLTRISGELDFLVLAPGIGIFALELK